MRAFLATLIIFSSPLLHANIVEEPQSDIATEEVEAHSPFDYEVLVMDAEDADEIGLYQLSNEELFGDEGVLNLFREEYDVASKSKVSRRGPRALKRSCAAVRNGTASWYGPGFHGRKAASGERFNQNALTAAHKTIPFNSIVRVCYKGRCTNVRINDAGPYSGGRVIDLSKAAARAIRMGGTGHVTLKVVRCAKS